MPISTVQRSEVPESVISPSVSAQHLLVGPKLGRSRSLERAARLASRRGIASWEGLRRTARPSARVSYRGRHNRALVRLRLKSANAEVDGIPQAPDAIIVPTSRPHDSTVRGIEFAVQLARNTGCYLVLMCSKDASAQHYRKKLDKQLSDGQLICVNSNSMAPDWLPRLSTDQHPLGVQNRSNDVSRKRNLGLALAAAMSWRAILFMDDDVFPSHKKTADAYSTLTVSSLRAAMAVFASSPDLKVIGWESRDFNDNSVVGHARSVSGLAQGVFPGSGAMLVRCEQAPFFPNIYNEDWLFMIACAVKSKRPHQTLSVAGSVRQQKYEPFVQSRARGEELGDILGEGMMNLLEDHGTRAMNRANSRLFWNRSIRIRGKMIRRVNKSLSGRNANLPPREKAKITQALRASLSVQSQAQADQIIDFVRSWRSDGPDWSVHLKKLAKAVQGDDRTTTLKAFAAGEAPPGLLLKIC